MSVKLKCLDPDLPVQIVNVSLSVSLQLVPKGN